MGYFTMMNAQPHVWVGSTFDSDFVAGSLVDFITLVFKTYDGFMSNQSLAFASGVPDKES